MQHVVCEFGAALASVGEHVPQVLTEEGSAIFRKSGLKRWEHRDADSPAVGCRGYHGAWVIR